MSAESYSMDADPIAAHLREFAAGHGATGQTVEDLWDDLTRRGIDQPGPNVATMLDDLEQFHPLVNNAHLTLTRQGTSVALGLHALNGGPAHEDTVDACFASLSRIARRFAGTLAAPVMVSLRRAHPTNAEEYDSTFEHVAFAQPADRCVFAATALTASIRHANPVVRSLLRPYAERRTHYRTQPWATAVTDLLTENTARLPAVAQALMVSVRTLQTKLSDEGHTFAALLDTVQRDNALSLLSQHDIPISSIATSLGFATASAFTRATRRWTDMTPSEYRAAAPVAHVR
jgi:AraC-like DNA-binding protein